MPPEFEINILLLVEDSDDDIIITQRKLFKSNLKINQFLIAKSLSEGIEVVKHNHVDIVLLDLNLPETKGLDTLVEFRKIYNGIIIVVTSLDDEMTGVESIRRGADDYLIKSALSESMLARTVMYARERRRLRVHSKSADDKLNQLDEKIAGV